MPDRDLALTFAGGGNRAFYQLGLLHVRANRLVAGGPRERSRGRVPAPGGAPGARGG